MRKTIKALLILGSVGAMCAGLAACSHETKIDEYFKNGNIIKVTYDGSGGEILSSNQVTIVDMFNPDKYEADSDGYIRIKLRDPSTRPGKIGNIKVSRTGYSLVGWYQKREVVKDGEGNVIDDAGNKLTKDELTETYYRIKLNSDGKEIKEEAVPAYTFSDPWDFSKNRVEFKVGSDKLDMSLYAAWIPLYSFDYYYEVKNEETKQYEWTKFATTRFDYLAAKELDRSDSTKITDSVFIPKWSTDTGKMEHKYSNVYTFPSVDKMTFKAAYTNEACTDEITLTSPFRHQGSLDDATAAAIDPVQNIYVKFDEGSRYRVSTAKQFAEIADPDGYYTILTDELDFNCSVDYETGGLLSFPAGSYRWPISLTTSTFTGKIEREGGGAVTFKNVGAQYSSANAEKGGLFGEIGEKAVIKNVAFENVVFDYQSATSRRGANLGMFAGNIDEKATVQNVTIGGQLRLWEISVSGGAFNFNLLANGNRAGVSETRIKVIVCGSKRTETQFYFSSIEPENGVTKVDANGKITFEAPASNNRLKEKQYYTVYGGDENE